MTQLLSIVQKIVFINKKKKGGLEFFFMYVCHLRKKREEREGECVKKMYTQNCLEFSHNEDDEENFSNVTRRITQQCLKL